MLPTTAITIHSRIDIGKALQFRTLRPHVAAHGYGTNIVGAKEETSKGSGHNSSSKLLCEGRECRERVTVPSSLSPISRHDAQRVAPPSDAATPEPDTVHLQHCCHLATLRGCATFSPTSALQKRSWHPARQAQAAPCLHQLLCWSHLQLQPVPKKRDRTHTSCRRRPCRLCLPH